MLDWFPGFNNLELDFRWVCARGVTKYRYIGISQNTKNLYRIAIQNVYCNISRLFLLLIKMFIFSAPEPKAQVHYCDHALSVVRPSVCPLLTFHIFNFSSETAERNSMKLDRKQDLNILYQVCVFRADRKNKMAALASDWLRHFATSPLKLLNRI